MNELPTSNPLEDPQRAMVLDSTESILLRYTEQLCDGQTIDWKRAAAELPTELLEQLKQIDALAGGFQQQRPSANSSAAFGDLLSPGTLFGPLVVQALLGRGSFGAVYQALDPQLDRPVALKVLAHPTIERAALLREGQLMARIDHPNVLKVYGALEAHGNLAFACELMRGESMEHWLTQHGALSPSELISIGGELCAALCALHRGQVLHGDLKPSNVLRHPDGRWVVADFGSSQVAEDAYGSSGTPRYMAPEQFQGEPLSQATDQYSLGVMLFRLASGRFPFEAETTGELEKKHASDDRLRLLDLRPDLPRHLHQAIEKALSLDPLRRHRSIGEFAEALSGQPLPSRRHSPWLAWATAASLLLSASAWWWLRPTPPSTPELTWVRAGATLDEVLHRGGAVRPGDALSLELQLPASRHVYVINEDALGQRFQLFPIAESSLGNPLPAGQHRLPGQAGEIRLDWRITSRGGYERFFVLISEHPLDELPRLALSEASSRREVEGGLLAITDEVTRGVGGVQAQSVANLNQDAAPAWLQSLLVRHPTLRVERFELANP